MYAYARARACVCVSLSLSRTLFTLDLACSGSLGYTLLLLIPESPLFFWLLGIGAHTGAALLLRIGTFKHVFWTISNVAQDVSFRNQQSLPRAAGCCDY